MPTPPNVIKRFLIIFLKGIIYFFGGLVSLILVLMALWYRTDLSVEELEPKYLTPESRYQPVDDAKLHIRKRGEGPVLFLIHGSFSSLHTWEGWENVLSKSFTTISMDLPGHGLTGPNGRENYSTDYYANLVIALADTLKIDTFYVAGNSMGGNVAWKMALKRPDRIKKLILVDASGFQKAPDASARKPSRPLIFQILNNKFLSRILAHITPRFLFKTNLKAVYANPAKFTDEIVDRYYLLVRRQGNRRATLLRFQNHGKDLQDSIPLIKTPTLIIWGGKDTWIPPIQGQYFHNQIRNSRLILSPDLGHVPMEESPMATADSAAAFLMTK